ncbi:MAG: hypothetical protein ACPGGK_00790 [Pikeienuella sp.]
MTPKRKSETQKSRTGQNVWASQKWRTLIVLPVMIVATLLGWYAIWGLLFVYWGYLALTRGEVFLVEAINRDEDPALFWILMALWFGSGAYYIASAFYPNLLA